jgi:carboxyl-terminal processing protease
MMKKNYSALLDANLIAPYVEEHPEMTEAEIASYAEELKKDFNLDSRLLRRIIRIQVNRTKPTALYDLDYDIQLNAALELLNTTEDFEKLLQSTKTLKELQVEAEAKKAAEKAAESETSTKAE